MLSKPSLTAIKDPQKAHRFQLCSEGQAFDNVVSVHRTNDIATGEPLLLAEFHLHDSEPPTDFWSIKKLELQFLDKNGESYRTDKFSLHYYLTKIDYKLDYHNSDALVVTVWFYIDREKINVGTTD